MYSIYLFEMLLIYTYLLFISSHFLLLWMCLSYASSIKRQCFSLKFHKSKMWWWSRIVFTLLPSGPPTYDKQKNVQFLRSLFVFQTVCTNLAENCKWIAQNGATMKKNIEKRRIRRKKTVEKTKPLPLKTTISRRNYKETKKPILSSLLKVFFFVGLNSKMIFSTMSHDFFFRCSGM